jgi:hypothetical protein
MVGILSEMKINYQILSVLLLSTSLIYDDKMSTLDAQENQMEYDSKYFEINHDFEKLRHILLHLMKSTGKLASYCEIKEHGKPADPTQLTDEVLPDLYMHALQIANLFEVDLGTKYEKRIESNIKRITMNKAKTAPTE